MLKKIPNLLSSIRIIFIPLIIYGLIIDDLLLSLIFSYLVCLSDLLDGYLARRYNSETQIGFYLDALGDKAFIISLYLAMSIKLLLPFYLIAVVVFKDLFILASYLIAFLLKNQLKIKISKLSKLNTAFQMILILLILMAEVGEFSSTSIFEISIEIFCFVVAFTTILSLILYIFNWIYGYN